MADQAPKHVNQPESPLASSYSWPMSRTSANTADSYNYTSLPSSYFQHSATFQPSSSSTTQPSSENNPEYAASAEAPSPRPRTPDNAGTTTRRTPPTPFSPSRHAPSGQILKRSGAHLDGPKPKRRKNRFGTIYNMSDADLLRSTHTNDEIKGKLNRSFFLSFFFTRY